MENSSTENPTAKPTENETRTAHKNSDLSKTISSLKKIQQKNQYKKYIRIAFPPIMPTSFTVTSIINQEKIIHITNLPIEQPFMIPILTCIVSSIIGLYLHMIMRDSHFEKQQEIQSADIKRQQEERDRKYADALDSFLKTEEKHLDRLREVLHDEFMPIVRVSDIIDPSEFNDLESAKLRASKIDLKRLVEHYIFARHIKRISSLRMNTWTRVYDYQILFELLDFLFRTHSDSNNELLDYMVTANPEVWFPNPTYYRAMLDLRKSYNMCKTSVSILVCFDYNVSKFYDERDNIVPLFRKLPENSGENYLEEHLGDEAQTKSPITNLERCIKIIIKEFLIEEKGSAPDDEPLMDAYTRARRKRAGSISLKIISHRTMMMIAGAGVESAKESFNVYDRIAVSRTIVSEIMIDREKQAPHVALSLDPRKVDVHTELFNDLWNESSDSDIKLFSSNDRLSDLGTGAIIRRWINDQSSE